MSMASRPLYKSSSMANRSRGTPASHWMSPTWPWPPMATTRGASKSPAGRDTPVSTTLRTEAASRAHVPLTPRRGPSRSNPVPMSPLWPRTPGFLVSAIPQYRQPPFTSSRRTSMSENIDDATQLSDTTRLSGRHKRRQKSRLLLLMPPPFLRAMTAPCSSRARDRRQPSRSRSPRNHSHNPSRSVSRAKPRKQPHRHCPPASIPDYCPSPRLRSGISSSPSMRWSKMSPRWLSARPSLSSNASPH